MTKTLSRGLLSRKRWMSGLHKERRDKLKARHIDSYLSSIDPSSSIKEPTPLVNPKNAEEIFIHNIHMKVGGDRDRVRKIYRLVKSGIISGEIEF